MSPLLTMDTYPQHAKDKLAEIETLIMATAQRYELGPVSSGIKWGQASYHVPDGTPIRLGWDTRTPESCFVYFHCQTKVISTAREVFSSELNFVANRAIELKLNRALPVALGECIKLALNYRKIKHLPLLGL